RILGGGSVINALSVLPQPVGPEPLLEQRLELRVAILALADREPELVGHVGRDDSLTGGGSGFLQFRDRLLREHKPGFPLEDVGRCPCRHAAEYECGCGHAETAEHERSDLDQRSEHLAVARTST